jgi:dimethyl sulfoxide reductase iron-sulfur subunit
MTKNLGMVIDLARCVGCQTCAIQCKLENNVGMGQAWNRILTVGGTKLDTPKGTFPDLELYYLPLACQHCEDPPCVKVCPVGCCYQRADGLVLIKWERCIGCRYCVAACPYSGVRTFNWGDPKHVPDFQVGDADVPPRERGVTEKCTFCFQRVDKGLDPACVVTCPARARFFGDIDDPQSQVSKLIKERSGYQLQPEIGTDPKVYFLPPRRKGFPTT